MYLCIEATKDVIDYFRVVRKLNKTIFYNFCSKIYNLVCWLNF